MLKNIEQRIYNVVFPSHWLEEDIKPPTLACKQEAFKVCSHLLTKYLLKPRTIASTKEEGIFLVFDNDDGTTLYIEVYNDLDIAALISKDKKTLFCEDIVNFNFDPCINKFDNPTT